MFNSYKTDVSLNNSKKLFLKLRKVTSLSTRLSYRFNSTEYVQIPPVGEGLWYREDQFELIFYNRSGMINSISFLIKWEINLNTQTGKKKWQK